MKLKNLIITVAELGIRQKHEEPSASSQELSRSSKVVTFALLGVDPACGQSSSTEVLVL